MTASADPGARHDLWAVELSPFALKLSAMLAWARIPYRWLPREGGRFENLRALLRIERAKRAGRVLRHGGMTDLDEYPSVPFLIAADRSVHYDSSALADWIDAEHTPPAGRLVPEDPALAFLARLVDEAFDEYGLYMVHHNRWVLAAADNGAGERLAGEMSRLLPPPLPALLAKQFPRRQCRRLPYLFSVAEGELDLGLPAGITPPARAGFPGTHGLLDASWHACLEAIEGLLTQQPYLLGGRFTVADASVYGQLGMNLTDPSANDALAARAPRTHTWLLSIRDGAHLEASGALETTDAERPLLDFVAQTFVPLMQQNERAFAEAVARGETLFNEAAFDRGRALYDGELMGQRFRSVVKSFQVRVWRDLRARWQALAADARHVVEKQLPGIEQAFSRPSR